MKKRIPSIDEFLNENAVITRGDIEFSDVKKFLKFIDEMPGGFKTINVPTEFNNFQSRSVTIQSSDADWKNKIKDIVTDIAKNKRKPDTFMIRSYFGNSNYSDPHNQLYIQYSDTDSRQFAQDMSSGKYGSLD